MTAGVCFQCNISHLAINGYKNMYFFAFKTWNKPKHMAFLINYRNAIRSCIYLDLIKDGYHTFFAYSFRLAQTLSAKIYAYVFNINRIMSLSIRFLYILLSTQKHPDNTIFSVFCLFVCFPLPPLSSC